MNTIAPSVLPVSGDSPMNLTPKAVRASSAAKEFESVLLGQWLRNAESTFGSVPGSEDDDAGGQQMKDFAMQHMATELANRGGIGIAPMVERALAVQEVPHAAKKPSEAVVGREITNGARG